jgi:hypothetical protein
LPETVKLNGTLNRVCAIAWVVVKAAAIAITAAQSKDL